MVKARRLGYPGHVARYPDGRWVKKILGATPTGKKSALNAVGWTKTMRKACQSLGVTWEILENRSELDDVIHSAYDIPAKRSGKRHKKEETDEEI